MTDYPKGPLPDGFFLFNGQQINDAIWECMEMRPTRTITMFMPPDAGTWTPPLKFDFAYDDPSKVEVYDYQTTWMLVPYIDELGDELSSGNICWSGDGTSITMNNMSTSYGIRVVKYS